MFSLEFDPPPKPHPVAGGAIAHRLPLAEFCARFDADTLYEARLYVRRGEDEPDAHYCEFIYKPADETDEPPFPGCYFLLLPAEIALADDPAADVTLAIGRKAEGSRLSPAPGEEAREAG